MKKLICLLCSMIFAQSTLAATIVVDDKETVRELVAAAGVGVLTDSDVLATRVLIPMAKQGLNIRFSPGLKEQGLQDSGGSANVAEYMGFRITPRLLYVSEYVEPEENEVTLIDFSGNNFYQTFVGNQSGIDIEVLEYDAGIVKIKNNNGELSVIAGVRKSTIVKTNNEYENVLGIVDNSQNSYQAYSVTELDSPTYVLASLLTYIESSYRYYGVLNGTGGHADAIPGLEERSEKGADFLRAKKLTMLNDNEKTALVIDLKKVTNGNSLLRRLKSEEVSQPIYQVVERLSEDEKEMLIKSAAEFVLAFTAEFL
jgi:hypothetical protein